MAWLKAKEEKKETQYRNSNGVKENSKEENIENIERNIKIEENETSIVK
jgi:hypothetical protein